MYRNTMEPLSSEEPSELNTGTAQTAPHANHNQTEPGPAWTSHVSGDTLCDKMVRDAATAFRIHWLSFNFYLRSFLNQI